MTISPDSHPALSVSIPVAASSGTPPELVERVAWLAREQVASDVPKQRATLLLESAQLRETVQDEAGAARDYLAAYNADVTFREPVEALAALLQRRKSFKNLGKLLDAMTKAAASPEQSACAHIMRGGFLLEQAEDVAGARGAFEQAAAGNPDDAAAWLELELIAGKTHDGELRLLALEERIRQAEPAQWKALLLIDLARLLHDRGDVDRAFDALRDARELDSPAKFRSLVAIEQAARKERRDDVLAEVLEAQAEMIALALDEPSSALSSGVPAWLCVPSHAADAFLRASNACARTGDSVAAASLLALAAARLPDDPTLMHAQLLAAEASSDTDVAAGLAKRLIDAGAPGRVGAALWMTMFEAAAGTGQREAAVDALAKALQLDPGCIPARAFQLDIIVDSDPAAFADSLEAMAEEGLGDDAKGRACLLAAWAWALRANDVPGAKAALSQAAMFGVGPGTIARLARLFASMVHDDAWFEESTRRLLAAGCHEPEQGSLWFELARARLLRQDDDGARQALDALAGAPGGLWLGRVLAAYALGLSPAHAAQPELSPEPLDQLAAAETDASAARALFIAACIRRLRAGHADDALPRLRVLHQEVPDDLLVASMLADLERAAGRLPQAASVLSLSAAAQDDAQVSAALHLEAAFLFWRAKDQTRAVEELSAARAQLPASASAVLLWAVAASDPDSLDGRRKVLELAQECDADRIALALDRFAVESNEGGDADASGAALDTIETQASGDLRAAGWLARLVSPWDGGDAARERARDGLATLGLNASAVVAAETYRAARTSGLDRERARDAAQGWALADGGAAAALEWMAAARAVEDGEAEVSAKRLLARHFDGAAAAALQSSAALVDLVTSASGRHPPLVASQEHPARLMNLELAPPGCDPRRRASALLGVGDALGETANLDARMLAGWSLLAAGDAQAAIGVFRGVVDARPEDLVSWEGVRTAAEELGDTPAVAAACERLGALCKDAPRAAQFFETAALAWLDQANDPARGEEALRSAFALDPTRFVAFDRLFRRVRAREDNDQLLALIARRLEVAEHTPEIAKLFWEQARVLRQKGDFEGAMSALDNVTMLEPNHVGALALAGEICIRRGDFPQAAEHLAQLATRPDAPAQQRLISGMAAVDLCENRLKNGARAMQILLTLTNAGLGTLPVRDRLARCAVQNEAWSDAAATFEILMRERPAPEGRIDAARSAMAICRDKLGDLSRAATAASKLLEETPTDAEALNLLIAHPGVADGTARTKHFHIARRAIVDALGIERLEVGAVELLSRIALEQGDRALRQATLGALISMGGETDALARELEALDARAARTPQVVLNDAAITAVNDDRDRGPVPQLFQMIAEVVAEALGPSLAGLAVSKRERIDARDGHPLRNEIAQWAGTLGIGEFELYVGGRDPLGVVGVPGDPPMLVVGMQVSAPLSPRSRQAVARELFALRRGISVVRTRDDATVASIVVAACGLAKVPIQAPAYAILAEVQRQMSKAMPGKVKRLLPDVCQAIATSHADPIAWFKFAHASLDRAAAIAAGDVSLVLSDVFGLPRERIGSATLESDRARELLAFVLSDRYLELRTQLGMGVR